MAEPNPREDDASLYVLGLMDEDEQQAFERRLADVPALAEEVRALQRSMEALAESAPVRSPRARVWSGIEQRLARVPTRRTTATAARTGTSVTTATTATTGAMEWWRAIGRVVRSGWAAAGALAVLWMVSEFRSERSTPSDVEGGASKQATTGRPAAGLSRREDRLESTDRSPGPAGSSAAIGQAKPSNAPVGASSGDEKLQARIQVLTDQVAALTRAVVERPVPGPGSAQLQVFRLVGTNGVAELSDIGFADSLRSGANPEEGQLQLALALAAARQWVASTASGTTATPDTGLQPDGLPNRFAGGTVPQDSTASSGGKTAGASDWAGLTPGVTDAAAAPGDGTAADPESIHVVDLTQGTSEPAAPVPVPAASGLTNLASAAWASTAAFGSYSPDTGQGAIAFRWGNRSTDASVLQLWAVDRSSGGTVSLGYVPASSPVMVVSFTTGGLVLQQPSFFITAEPPGGSALPTGPIIAQPPSTQPSP